MVACAAKKLAGNLCKWQAVFVDVRLSSRALKSKALISTLKRIIKQEFFPPKRLKDSSVVEAYGLWAENYDAQPGNLMLDLDEEVFGNLLNNIDIKNKLVADIGCGTGRHWEKLFAKQPFHLSGFDVSPGMLHKLEQKYPEASTHVIADNHFEAIADGFFDVVVSTLTVAHIEDIEEAVNNWCRILKRRGDVVVTDFHPDILAFGGKRTFSHQNKLVSVQNFVHTTETIKQCFYRNNFTLVCEEERRVDEAVKHYYTAQNALHVYEKFEGFPVIYGMHFRRV